MAENKRKNISSIIHDLYLYPNRSKGENLIRGLVWCISFAIGILAQHFFTPNFVDQRALCGAYLIYALSLLLEFALKDNEHLLGMIVHGLFLVLLCLIIVGAGFFSFSPTFAADSSTSNSSQSIVNLIIFLPGRIVAITILIGLILAVAGVDKWFYNTKEEEEKNAKEELNKKIDELVEKNKDILVRIDAISHLQNNGGDKE